MFQVTDRIEGESGISTIPLEAVPCGDETFNNIENSRSNISRCEAESIKIRTQEKARAICTSDIGVENTSTEDLKLRRSKSQA